VSRYDLVPDDLILNNTLSIQYSATAPAPTPFNLTDAFVVFNETGIAPYVEQAIMPADVNYTFVITFDVSHAQAARRFDFTDAWAF
jgi:hypothetical protein